MEDGLKHRLGKVASVTGRWRNAAAGKANLHRWARTGWRRHLPNDERFPVTIWATA